MKGFFKFSKTKEEEEQQMMAKGKVARVNRKAEVPDQGR